MPHVVGLCEFLTAKGIGPSIGSFWDQFLAKVHHAHDVIPETSSMICFYQNWLKPAQVCELKDLSPWFQIRKTHHSPRILDLLPPNKPRVLIPEPTPYIVDMLMASCPQNSWWPWGQLSQKQLMELSQCCNDTVDDIETLQTPVDNMVVYIYHSHGFHIIQVDRMVEKATDSNASLSWAGCHNK